MALRVSRLAQLQKTVSRVENNSLSENYPLTKDTLMSDIQAHFDDHLKEMLDKATDNIDLASDDATTRMKNLKLFSECRPQPIPVAEPIPEPPTTRWGKFCCWAGRVWDNETTRVTIKAGGALSGVALVAYSTIHKDHVIERQAIAQANQRNS